MALQNTGPIKLSEIQTEFGGTNPISISEYYRGLEVPDAIENQSVPTSGTISMSDFYGTVDITYSLSLSPSATNYNEGTSITATVTTTSVPDSTTLYWTLDYTLGDNTNTLNSNNDFSAASGSFTINSNSGSFNFTINNDFYQEGQEKFQVNVRVNSVSGTIVESSQEITINDTSIDTYSLSSNKTSMYETESATITLTTQGVPNGATVPYTITGISVSSSLDYTLDNPNAYGTSAGDAFSRSVAITDLYAIVGAPAEDDAGGTTSGKAYIYSNSTGNLLYTLDNPNPYGTSAGDAFGRSVAISDLYAIVSAPFEDEGVFDGTDSGKAYIFSTSTGNLIRTLNNSNDYTTPGDDYFGLSVDISDSYAIVGAPEESFFSSGKAYIYSNSTGSLLHTLDNPNAYGSSDQDRFGTTVSISESYAIVGAPDEDAARGGRTGAAYIFSVNTGNLVYTLLNPNVYNTLTSIDDGYARSIDITDNYAIVGAYLEDESNGNGSGVAYIYSTSTGNLVHTLANPNTYGTVTNDYFGWSVGITDNYAIVGARQEDDAGGANSGKAYIFDIVTGNLLATIDNPNAYDTATSDLFGGAVAISNSYALVGAEQEDDASGTDSGKAYIFKLVSDDITQSLTGSFTVNNNTATTTITAEFDNLIESTETLTLSLDNGKDSISIDILDSTYSLSSNKTSMYEGESATITLTTQGVPNGATVPYTITGVSAGDISESLTGSFTVNSNTATTTVTALYDGVSESTETLTLSLNNGESSVNVNILAPTFSLSRSASTINEGQSITITLNTNGIPDSTNIPYTITGIDSADLSSGSITGNFTVSSGTATQVFTMANDFTTEGTETATLTLGSPGSGSIGWTIVDTSRPTFTLSRSASSVTEGNSFTITLSTQGVPNGTTVGYTITGVDSSDINVNLTGTFTVNNNTATLSVGTNVNDDSVAYVLGEDSGHVIKQYSVSSDLQTTSFVTSLNLGNVSGFSTGSGMYLKSDGTRLWVQDPGTDKFWRWTLSTAWDLSTATSVTSASYGSVGGNHQGMWISPSGSNLFQVDRNIQYILYDSLSTAWDPFNPGQPSRFLDVGNDSINLPTGISVKPDGTVAFVSTLSPVRTIAEYSGTAYRPDLWTYQGALTTPVNSFPTDVFVNDAGTKMYVSDDSAKIHYYELSTGWDLTTASLIRTWDLTTDFNTRISAFYIVTITSETFKITLAANDSIGNSTGTPSTTVTITG